MQAGGAGYLLQQQSKVWSTGHGQLGPICPAQVLAGLGDTVATGAS